MTKGLEMSVEFEAIACVSPQLPFPSTLCLASAPGPVTLVVVARMPGLRANASNRGQGRSSLRLIDVESSIVGIQAQVLDNDLSLHCTEGELKEIVMFLLNPKCPGFPHSSRPR